jgi:hypothetical protein
MHGLRDINAPELGSSKPCDNMQGAVDSTAGALLPVGGQIIGAAHDAVRDSIEDAICLAKTFPGAAPI